MGGFGSAQGMITAIKNNNRRKKREAYDGWTESDKESQGIKVEPVSEKTLSEIRKKMKKQQQVTFIKNFIIAIIGLIAFFFFIQLVFLYFENDPGIGWNPY
ncbi:hypothetical protein [Aquimarina algiphila]|uniref:Uncharacterized protein n=1 Tax=Aquimarina algiphila TaxID=2047982 RepID=A0A554VMZ9_9FLAO|nr:hypothetical protein [Aquimarina algiphila]TSE09728.1 hypothetical protein FOF46_06860 [Aquimarina algiphila]